jgi:hypothetical protein
MSTKTSVNRSSKKEKVQADVNLDDVDPLNDETAGQIQRDNELVESALLGYGKADITKLVLSFGKWNIRKINEDQVQMLANCFEHEGIQRYLMKNLVPLVVDKDDVVGELAKKASNGGDLYPQLKFKSTATSPIIAAGGQHRLAAIMKLKESYMQQISNLEQDDDDIIELKKKLKGIGLWGFALYDKGKLILYTKFKSIEYYDFLIAIVDSRVGKILAANNTLHNLSQTPTEWFVSLIGDIHEEVISKSGTVDDIDAETHEKYWTQAKKKQTTYGDIIMTKPVLLSLLTLYPLIQYYAHTTIFHPTPLKRDMFGSFGGVSKIHFTLCRK